MRAMSTEHREDENEVVTEEEIYTFHKQLSDFIQNPDHLVRSSPTDPVIPNKPGFLFTHFVTKPIDYYQSVNLKTKYYDKAEGYYRSAGFNIYVKYDCALKEREHEPLLIPDNALIHVALAGGAEGISNRRNLRGKWFKIFMGFNGASFK